MKMGIIRAIVSGAMLATAAAPALSAKAVTLAPALTPTGVFNSLEFSTNSVAGISSWTRALKKLADEESFFHLCDSGDVPCPPELTAWRRELAALRGQSPRTQVIRINQFANQAITYTDDKKAFGKKDFWATPRLSLKGKGDCEDYALLKYASLKQLGFAEDDLRVVVLNDTRKGIGHAVLSVRIGTETFILDNQDARVLRHDAINHYAPVYSINANGRWINISVKDLRRKRVAEVALEAEDIVPAASGLKHRMQAVATIAKMKPAVRLASDAGVMVVAGR